MTTQKDEGKGKLTGEYNPMADAAARWPYWTIRHMEFSAGEGISRRDRILYVNADPSDHHRTAHVLAHLDLGHHLADIEWFTDQMERDAEDLAKLRLGYDIMANWY